VDSGEMSITEYDSSTYQFVDSFLNFFKIGGLSIRILSFDPAKIEFSLEFTFHYVVDYLRLLDTDNGNLIMNK